MRPTKYRVVLTPGERSELLSIVSNGKSTAKKIRRANILLMLDASTGNAPSQKDIADLCHTSTTTVYTIGRQYHQGGLSEALDRKPRATPPVPPLLDARATAQILALRHRRPPAGHKRWTTQLLADAAVEAGIVDQISKSTIGRMLKKHAKQD
ncbi:helix-turn-helix domain-containing protein [Eubacteriales bacterium OttesenSCG-928-A19]|nr:helix-turn-helix domain-containing protein [Eubacteriales bacterium OttesenSCG-928-A19]